MNCFRGIFQGLYRSFRKIYFKEHLPLAVFVVKSSAFIKTQKDISNMHMLFNKNALLKRTRITEHKVNFFIA